MASLFVPQGSSVICTMMTCGTPQEIGITRTAYNLHKGKGQPLLNINDKKLSAAFGCKNAKKFWGGLEALCLGIALAAAVVLTGGAAIAVVAVAMTVALGACGTSIYKAAHDCDVISSSQWKKYHMTVKIEKANALLNESYIECPNNGLINIIIDPAIAKEAAEYISNNNNKEILAQEASMFAMGFVSVYSAAFMVPAGAAAVSAASFSGFMAVAMYTPGEWLGKNIPNATGGNIASNAAADGATTIVTLGKNGLIKETLTEVAKNATSIRYMGEGLVRYAGTTLMKSAKIDGVLMYVIAKSKFKFSIDKPGLGGMLVNIIIGSVSDNYENNLADDTKKASIKFNDRDSSNGISIIAITQ